MVFIPINGNSASCLQRSRSTEPQLIQENRNIDPSEGNQLRGVSSAGRLFLAAQLSPSRIHQITNVRSEDLTEVSNPLRLRNTRREETRTVLLHLETAADHAAYMSPPSQHPSRAPSATTRQTTTTVYHKQASSTGDRENASDDIIRTRPESPHM